MTSWVRYPSTMPAVERMMLNDSYWEEMYERSKKIVTDDSSLLVKICPSCGWSGRTGLTFCHRKTYHKSSVKFNVVPSDLHKEVGQ